MAQNPPCQFNDGHSAMFVGTFFESGLSITTCADHFVSFLESSLRAMITEPLTLTPESPEAASPEVLDAGESKMLAEFEEWVEENRDVIQAGMDEGLTFDEAVTTLQKIVHDAAEHAELDTVSPTCHEVDVTAKGGRLCELPLGHDGEHEFTIDPSPIRKISNSTILPE